MVQVQSAHENTTPRPAVAKATRGEWDEITRITTAEGGIVRPREIVAKFASVLPKEFADFDRKKRGDALNIDLYGFDPAQEVAVFQIRHAFRRRANHFLNVRKDYVLCGVNETGTMFRHPISGGAIRAGIRQDDTNPVAAVRAAQRWMWSATDAQLAAGIRQGDVLLIPVRAKPAKAETIEENTVIVGGTHEVHASGFLRDAKGVVYALAPTIRHTKGQHDPIFGDNDGWHRVSVGREATTWDWGVRLGD